MYLVSIGCAEIVLLCRVLVVVCHATHLFEMDKKKPAEAGFFPFQEDVCGIRPRGVVSARLRPLTTTNREAHQSEPSQQHGVGLWLGDGLGEDEGRALQAQVVGDGCTRHVAEGVIHPG